jgi:hypothetical protein
MGEYKQGLCTLCVRLSVSNKICGALVTAVDVCRGVIDVGKVPMGHLVCAVGIGTSIQFREMPLLWNFSLLM